MRTKKSNFLEYVSGDLFCRFLHGLRDTRKKVTWEEAIRLGLVFSYILSDFSRDRKGGERRGTFPIVKTEINFIIKRTFSLYLLLKLRSVFNRF